MTEIKMLQWQKHRIFNVLVSVILSFGIRICFGFRYSDFAWIWLFVQALIRHILNTLTNTEPYVNRFEGPFSRHFVRSLAKPFLLEYRTFIRYDFLYQFSLLKKRAQRACGQSDSKTGHCLRACASLSGLESDCLYAINSNHHMLQIFFHWHTTPFFLYSTQQKATSYCFGWQSHY